MNENMREIYEKRTAIINSGEGVFQIALRANDKYNLFLPPLLFPCKVRLSSTNYEMPENDPFLIKTHLIEGGSIKISCPEGEGLLDRWRVASIQGPFVNEENRNSFYTIPEAASLWERSESRLRSFFKDTLKNNNQLIPKYLMQYHFGALESLPKNERPFFKIPVKDYSRYGTIIRDYRLEEFIREKENLSRYLKEQSLI